MGQDAPYRILDRLPPDREKVESIKVLREANKATAALTELNGIENTEFYAGDMQALLTEEFFNEHGRPDVIVTDPPRAGMHPDVTALLNNSGAKRIAALIYCKNAYIKNILIQFFGF